MKLLRRDRAHHRSHPCKQSRLCTCRLLVSRQLQLGQAYRVLDHAVAHCEALALDGDYREQIGRGIAIIPMLAAACTSHHLTHSLSLLTASSPPLREIVRQIEREEILQQKSMHLFLQVFTCELGFVWSSWTACAPDSFAPASPHPPYQSPNQILPASSSSCPLSAQFGRRIRTMPPHAVFCLNCFSDPLLLRTVVIVLWTHT